MNKKNIVPEDYFLKKDRGIEYFLFEEDFVEKNIRCIPMIVRFKLDAVGIKLKLSEWSRFSAKERVNLALEACTSKEDLMNYRTYVKHLVNDHTGHEAKEIEVDENPAWANPKLIQRQLQEKAKEFGWEIPLEKWKALTSLQRFALMKLCRPGHENKNFPKAMKEFGLI